MTVVQVNPVYYLMGPWQHTFQTHKGQGVVYKISLFILLYPLSVLTSYQYRLKIFKKIKLPQETCNFLFLGVIIKCQEIHVARENLIPPNNFLMSPLVATYWLYSASFSTTQMSTVRTT